MQQMLVKRIGRVTKNFFKRCAPMATLATLLSLGIAAGVMAEPSPPPVEARLEPLSNFPQTTLSILTPDARQHVFTIWLADTEAHREQGLMFVKSLEPNAGMLFIFDEPQIVTMWMKNTLISLDMVFIDKNGLVTRVLENAKPLSLEILSSKDTASAVLELKGGVAKTLGIRAGARVKYSFFTASSGSK